jgi:ABC-type Mn2+/Zn2+ transport system permease subunit
MEEKVSDYMVLLYCSVCLVHAWLILFITQLEYITVYMITRNFEGLNVNLFHFFLFSKIHS